jgi:hypothetical protein
VAIEPGRGQWEPQRAPQCGSQGTSGWQASGPQWEAEPAAFRGWRRRPPLLAAAVALVGVGGLIFAGLGISGQFMPRQFTPAQRSQIQAWEVASRWRTTPKTKIFPARMRYALTGPQLGLLGSLNLTARRLGIARQASCARAAGVGPQALLMLRRDGCQAMLRATYTDATSSLVLTVGVAVMRGESSAQSAARYLTGGAAGAAANQGAVARHQVLSPVQVPGTPAAAFGARQRQLGWVVGSGSYLVMATAGFADGRPGVKVSSDPYTLAEMTSLARGVAAGIAAPLGAQPPVPHCPKGPGC